MWSTDDWGPVTSPRAIRYLAAAAWPVLLVYVSAQAGLGLLVAPRLPHLKLVFEPFLLLLGLILHVHWRRICVSLSEAGLKRPWYVALGDCLSFVTTFWALALLVEAILHELRIV
ncbi:MAG: hypothetical protein C4297_00805 [Gemmataceae bacterium]